MNSETFKLPKDTFLSNLEPFASKGLPTNSIIHKMVTGCGATTLELSFPRNSIIIEPNLPVIKGKCAKINGKARKNKIVQGVHEDVSVDDIKYYLANVKGYKKILTTPEGFEKVSEAIGESMYADYFLLFDECEKAIQDIDFRDKIIDPIDAFFEFDNKAFVSATPLIPSDPRFKDFTRVIIEPDYEFDESIKVFSTNNIVYQLKIVLDKYLSSDNSNDRKIFIFFKSTKRIRNIINGLKLEDYAVYCSEDSAKDLRRDGISNAYDSVNNKFAKYNFLTSRFYSAVDIDYKDYACDPIIIIMTDVVAVQHSVIDPLTEAIQICGRFRKPEKVKDEPEIWVTKDIYHISNYSNKLTSYNETEIEAILNDKKRLHDFISTFQPQSDVEYINTFIDEILELNGFGYFIREKNGELNYFKIDNFIYKERVKRYYKSDTALVNQYKLSKHFDVHEQSRYVYHGLTDQQLLEIKDNTASQKANDIVSQWLKNIMETGNDDLWLTFNLTMLRNSFKKQMEIIDQYGLQNASLLDYDINKIQKELENSKGLQRLIPIIKYIRRVFEIGKGYTSKEIEESLFKGLAETGLINVKPDIKLLRNGVNLSERQNIKRDEKGAWLKGYKVLSYLHNF